MAEKNKWKGNEFIPNSQAKIDWGNGKITKCKVLYWSKHYGGWWYVQLENGCYHYTRRLI
jgi:hypothetical protein